MNDLIKIDDHKVKIVVAFDKILTFDDDMFSFRSINDDCASWRIVNLIITLVGADESIG